MANDTSSLGSGASGRAYLIEAGAYPRRLGLCLAVARVASGAVSGGGWMFLWMMVALKVPIAALLTLVWWASRTPEPREPEPRAGRPARPRPTPPRPRRPGPPRGGPHAERPPQPPKRMRVHARPRVLSH